MPRDAATRKKLAAHKVRELVDRGVSFNPAGASKVAKGRALQNLGKKAGIGLGRLKAIGKYKMLSQGKSGSVSAPRRFR